jgi:hypothetical protein
MYEDQFTSRTNLQKVNWSAPRWLRRRRKQGEVDASHEVAAIASVGTRGPMR